ncbi:hypothetical protein FNAPI_5011 [Fusarium napiforme]|uniref:Uncharacterized protein n=1 Tax=Fusarium napiforme TaxID=42672 RepID=A0A8H5NAD3_9HYPO|nr:hypothetical protein FNAPI_5011 [Fusarium napiforme]
MAHAEEAAASPAQPSPGPVATPAAEPEEIALPPNVTCSQKDRHIVRRFIQRIEVVVGQKPWEWLAEVQPKQ